VAQRSTVYRISIDLCDTDRQVYEELRMSVARADSETPSRLVARLLAYCLWYEPEITFTGGVGAGDEPDVWLKEPGGRIRLWLEVGLPDPKRLARSARHCDRVALLAYGRRWPDWQRESLPLLASLDNVTVVGLDDRFLEQLVDGLDRNVVWNLTVSGGTLYLEQGGTQFEGALSPVQG
jgi:uncharacterized protein YaeQ